MLNRITAETLGRNTAPAEGVEPATDWYAQGRMGRRNNNPESGLGLTHIDPWGVVFRAKDNPPSSDVLVRVGDLQLWVLPSATMTWTRLSGELRPDGLIYGADFDPPVELGAAPVHSDPPDMLVTEIAEAETAYHFYVDRVPYDALAGIIVCFSAQLVSRSGGDVSAETGRLLAQVGCDFKTSDGSVIRDAFVSSLVPIGPTMRRYTASTMTYGQLKANYPPSDVFTC